MRTAAASVLLVGLVILASCQDHQSAQTTTSRLPLNVTPPWDSLYPQQVEGAELKAACLREQGFEADVLYTVGGAGLVTYPGDQPEALEAARQLCDLRYAEYDIDFHPTNRQVYDWNLYTAQCLLQQGYDVGTPPSFEAWNERYPTGDAWDPWNVLMGDLGVSDEEVSRLYDYCPPF